MYGGRFFGDTGKAKVARHVRDVGRLLTATELRSADTYWHVRQSGPKSGIYPPEYKPLVVGIMWNMMAQVSLLKLLLFRPPLLMSCYSSLI